MKYQARIHWDKHRPEFFKLGLIIALSVVFMAFNFTSHPPIYEPIEFEDIEPDVLITPPITIHREEKPLPPPPPPVIRIISIIEPVMDPIFRPKEVVLIDDFKEVSKLEIDEFANTAPITPPVVSPVLDEEPITDKPYVFVERMPVYNRCSLNVDENERRSCTEESLLKHTQEFVKYPKMARQYGLEGTVVISFVVNKHGSVENIEIVKDIGMGCGEEVKRVIKKLGEFIPGKQNGKPVSVIYRLPVKFSLK